MEKQLKYFYRFNVANLVYSLVVIGWGVLVRASSSGAGCGAHWPLCNGEIIPTGARIQTLIEFAHRSSSGISLILVAIGLFWSRQIAVKGSPIRKAAGLTAIAIVLEALLGAGLVLLRLVEFDQSALRAFSISLHLINTLFLLGSIATLAFLSRHRTFYEKREFNLFPREPLFVVALAAFITLGVSGAITALGDTLFPATSLANGMQQDFATGAHFLIKLRVIHPVLATAWIVLVFLWSKRLETLELKNIRSLLLLAVICQFFLGVINWLLMAPTAMQILHLEVADGVFLSLWISGLAYETRESRLSA